jgi:hypothetical protein
MYWETERVCTRDGAPVLRVSQTEISGGHKCRYVRVLGTFSTTQPPLGRDRILSPDGE